MALGDLFSKPSDKTKRIWEFVKTFGDWIILIIGEVIAQVVGDVKPFHQLFSVLDPTISFPKAEHEKVPSYMLYVYCFGVPIVVILITTLVFGPGKLKRRLFLLNWGLLGVGASVIAAQIFTETIKFIVGRPRPDLLSRCKPDAARAQAAFTQTAVTLFSTSICTTTDVKELNDGFRSFPSGHASMSFAGLTYLALFLAGRLHLFTPHSTHGKHLYAYALSGAPLLLASFVTFSRVSDFRHRLSDVVGGALIGIFFGVLAFRYYYPWLNSPLAGTPWMTLRAESAEGEGLRSASRAGEPLLPTSFPGKERNLTTPYTDTDTPATHVDNPMEMRPIPPAQ
ncbi:acid phosphatase/Vanadium-dependent haloperoxidase [Serendipita vermifera]|nr:acid phosphatase/Vanadium-dependent haloperoxidase [Serendipita vermifera]